MAKIPESRKHNNQPFQLLVSVVFLCKSYSKVYFNQIFYIVVIYTSFSQTSLLTARCQGVFINKATPLSKNMFYSSIWVPDVPQKQIGQLQAPVGHLSAQMSQLRAQVGQLGDQIGQPGAQIGQLGAHMQR